MSLATLDEDNSQNRLLRPGWLRRGENVYLMANVKFTKVQPQQPGYFYCTDQRLVWTKNHAVEVRAEADIPYTIIRGTQIWEGEAKHRRLTLHLRPDGRRDHHVQIFDFVSDTAPSEIIAFRNLIYRFTSLLELQEVEAAPSVPSSLLEDDESSTMTLTSTRPAIFSPSSSSSVFSSTSTPYLPFSNRSLPFSSSTSSSSTSSSSTSSSGSKSAFSEASRKRQRVGEVSQNLETLRYRAALLAADAELRRLHEEFVVDQRLVSETEFWEARRRQEIEASQTEPLQERGAPSELFGDVRYDADTEPISFKLTPTIIGNIFREYPAVQKAYNAQVPEHIPEKTFWERFFTSFYFTRQKLMSSDALSALSEDTFSQYSNEKDDLPSSRRLRTILPVIPTIIRDAPSGLGTAPDFTMQPSQLQPALPLIRLINRHADLVCSASPGASRDPQPELLSAPCPPDPFLSPPAAPEALTLSLSVQDKEHFFAAHARKEHNHSLGQDILQEDMRLRFSAAWRLQLDRRHQPYRPSQLLPAQFNGSLVEALKFVNSESNWSGLQRDVKSFQPGHLQALQMHHARVAELLRHFWSAWACYPFRSPAAVSKAYRLRDSIAALKAEIEGVQRSLPEIGPLFKQMIESLGHALAQIPVNGSSTKSLSTQFTVTNN